MAKENERHQIRVILKTWRHNEVVRDNAHDINWLTQQGWKVDCTETLLDDPAGGTSYVLYLLGWDGPGDPPKAERDSPPHPKPDDKKEKTEADGRKEAEPGKLYTIRIPKNGANVTFACHITRGRIRINELGLGIESPFSHLIPASPAPPSTTPLSEFVTVKVTADNPPRMLGIMCCHDSVASASPQSKYAEAAPAEATVQVFVTPHLEEPPIFRLFRVAIPPGQIVTYYIKLEREA